MRSLRNPGPRRRRADRAAGGPRAGVTVETPALLPVVNPNVLTIEPRRLAEEFGAEMLITNSYIIRSTDRIRDRVLDQGLHDFLGFDGAIATDSGSFQLAEYGDIDVTTEEIIEFQRQIGSDVATPGGRAHAARCRPRARRAGTGDDEAGARRRRGR